MKLDVLLRRSGIKISDEEAKALAADLDSIIALLEQIPEPKTHKDHYTHFAHLAEDKAQSTDTEAILKNAKSVQNNMFKIG